MPLLPWSEALSPDAEHWLNTAAEHSFFSSQGWLRLLAAQGWHATEPPFWLQGSHSLWPLAADLYHWSGLKLPRWRALANCYSSFYQPAGLLDDASIGQLSDAARQQRQAILELWPLHQDSADQLVTGLNRRGWHCHRYPLYGNWHQQLPDQFEQYWQQRSSQLRNTVQRRQKKLERQSHRFLLLTDTTQLDWGLAEFKRLYQKRWPGAELHPGFVPALIRYLAEQQQLRLGFLLLEEQVIAAQLWIVEQKRALMYKVAYDCDQQQYSPGSLLLRWMIEYLMQQDKIRVLDFLTGDDGYKAEWLDQREQRYGVQAVRWTHFPGILLASRNRLAQLVQPV